MIAHVVMLRLKDGYDVAELQAIMAGLSALKIEGFVGFEHGPNRDLEAKTPDHPYGFICRFDDLAALARYANNPDHKMLGGRLCDLCVGGDDGIMVMDLDL